MSEILWLTILLGALILDFLTEYPNFIHPTVWEGKVIEFFDMHRIAKTDFGLILNGIIPLIMDALIFFSLTFSLNYLPVIPKILMYIFLTKSTFSIGGLVRAIKKCEIEDIEILRRNVSMIVSRKTENLDRDHLYSAAFESGAESIVDSVISPLFYLAIFGLYGGLFYRIVNTADSLLGYRNERYEYFGKVSAKLDDVLNFIPARIYYLMLLIMGGRRVRSDIKKNSIKLNGKYSIIGTASYFKVGVEKIGFYRFAYYPFPGMRDLKKLITHIYLISYVFFLIILIFDYALRLPILR